MRHIVVAVERESLPCYCDGRQVQNSANMLYVTSNLVLLTLSNFAGRRFLEGTMNAAKAAAEGHEQHECPICMDNIAENDLALTPCGHFYHLACIIICSAP